MLYNIFYLLRLHATMNLSRSAIACGLSFSPGFLFRLLSRLERQVENLGALEESAIVPFTPASGRVAGYNLSFIDREMYSTKLRSQ